MISIYTQEKQGKAWISRYRGCSPLFACVLGFTETCLIPGISAAGCTVEDRKYTAVADAEFLYWGAKHKPRYPLPPLQAGASPAIISRAVVEQLKIPVYLFNAGLAQVPAVPIIDLGGSPAKCLTSGRAMELATVHHLLSQGLLWGDRLAQKIPTGYLILAECVVGGTTTALALLTALGINAVGKVNSSHPICNHNQKWAVVQAGLKKISKKKSRSWFNFRFLGRSSADCSCSGRSYANSCSRNGDCCESQLRSVTCWRNPNARSVCTDERDRSSLHSAMAARSCRDRNNSLGSRRPHRKYCGISPTSR